MEGRTEATGSNNDNKLLGVMLINAHLAPGLRDALITTQVWDDTVTEIFFSLLIDLFTCTICVKLELSLRLHQVLRDVIFNLSKWCFAA